jgi:hypothetical protein
MWQRLAKVLVVSIIAVLAVVGFAWRGVAPAAAADACSTVSTTPVSLTFVNNSGAPVNIYWSDFNCVEVPTVMTLANGASTTQASFVTHPWIVRDAGTGNALLCFVATGDATVTINSGFFVNNCAGTDGRLNLNLCDDQVAVYQNFDQDGNPILDVWGIETLTDANNQPQIVGRYLFSIGESDLADFEENLPSENTRIASENGVRAYILTSGEVQINTPTNAEGKQCVLIFDSLHPTRMGHYSFGNVVNNAATSPEATVEVTSVPATNTPAPTATP